MSAVCHHHQARIEILQSSSASVVTHLYGIINVVVSEAGAEPGHALQCVLGFGNGFIGTADDQFQPPGHNLYAESLLQQPQVLIALSAQGLGLIIVSKPQYLTQYIN